MFFQRHFFKTLFLGVLVIANTNCSKSADPPVITPADTIPVNHPDTFVFAKGADIGWLSQMEQEGIKFYNSSGTQQDCIQILKDKGINAIRLRVWVNPAAGWCNTDDVLAQAVRAHSIGMRIMIDFHYSDTWADPGHQQKPAAWQSLAFADMATALSNHTKDVLTRLKQAGITPEWVQVGNETNDGMLWEEGRASAHMNQFATLVKAGYDAVKQINDSIKVIVHISNGFDNGLFRWIFDGLKNNGAKWDVIGMSLYPAVNNWASLTQQCLTNMNDMLARYGTPVMICEVGMPYDQPAACKSFLTDIISKVKSLPGHKGLGVFYWEPESYNNWQGYTLGAFDNTGKPTQAMGAFAE